ncbi:MAG TPA: S53 family peptidase [Thermoplasmata archaeon]|nr:S53 family peptidase [Thermoplasmata archaeon]
MSPPAPTSSGATRELTGSYRPPLPGAQDSGAWSKDDHIELSVLLRRGSAGSLEPTFASLEGTSIAHRTYLTRTRFAAIHSAREADVRHVREFGLRQGLSVGMVDPVRRTMSLHGSIASAARAFGVEVHRFDHPSATYRAPLAPIQLPVELGETVVGVFGLDNRPQLRPHFRRNADPRATGYPVPTVGAAYSFPTGLTGSDQCIGLLEFGGGYSSEDLASYFGGLGVPVPEVVSVGVDGAANAPTGDPNGPDAEVELDIETAGALAPAARIVVYFAPNTEQGFVDAMTTAVHDNANRPSVISISWGGPENSWSATARAAFEAVTQDGALQGVTILAASGDQGASDGEATGNRTVDFPASSPYVLGCGGTRLTLAGGKIVSETVWNDLGQNEGATGGGVSEEFPKPSYQTGAVVPSAPNGFAGRGVPDVAGNADPQTGYAVFVDGAPAVIGGTSAVAPLWAALVARLSQGIGKPLGFANPAIYSAAVSSTLRDITSGDNGGYTAGPGWDPCTGLGSPQGSRLLAALKS